MGKLTAKQVIAYSKADPKKYSDGIDPLLEKQKIELPDIETVADASAFLFAPVLILAKRYAS